MSKELLSACRRAVVALAAAAERMPEFEKDYEFVSEALANLQAAKPAQTCNYPDCNCPFDAPADPSWCARGLPKQAAKPTDALGSLPVVAWRINTGHGSSVKEWIPEEHRSFWKPLTDHAQATEALAKKEAFWKRVVNVADAQTNQYIEKCKALEAKLAVVDGLAKAAVAFIDSHAADPDITQEMREKYSAYQEALATYEIAQGEKK